MLAWYRRRKEVIWTYTLVVEAEVLADGVVGVAADAALDFGVGDLVDEGEHGLEYVGHVEESVRINLSLRLRT